MFSVSDLLYSMHNTLSYRCWCNAAWKKQFWIRWTHVLVTAAALSGMLHHNIASLWPQLVKNSGFSIAENFLHMHCYRLRVLALSSMPVPMQGLELTLLSGRKTHACCSCTTSLIDRHHLISAGIYGFLNGCRQGDRAFQAIENQVRSCY